jgi:hypothetical protein
VQQHALELTFGIIQLLLTRALRIIGRLEAACTYKYSITTPVLDLSNPLWKELGEMLPTLGMFAEWFRSYPEVMVPWWNRRGTGTVADADGLGGFWTVLVSVLNFMQRSYDKSTWHGARFSAEIYTRGCHWIPRMFA